MNLDIPDQLTERYKLNAWYIGVGVRLTPFKGLLEEHNWSPFVDFGTSYNAIFSGKSPFDNNLDQFGKGMSTSVGLGVRFVDDYNEDGMNISIAFTFPQYDYFNRDFELSNGVRPYAGIKARNYSIFLKIMKEF